MAVIGRERGHCHCCPCGMHDSDGDKGVSLPLLSCDMHGSDGDIYFHCHWSLCDIYDRDGNIAVPLSLLSM